MCDYYLCDHCLIIVCRIDDSLSVLFYHFIRFSTVAAKYDLHQNEGYRGEILRDVSRTFPFHPLFYSDIDRDEIIENNLDENNIPIQLASSLGERMLCNILMAVAVARPSVGYCQGMNFVVGLLLIVGIASSKSKNDLLALNANRENSNQNTEEQATQNEQIYRLNHDDIMLEAINDISQEIFNSVSTENVSDETCENVPEDLILKYLDAEIITEYLQSLSRNSFDTFQNEKESESSSEITFLPEKEESFHPEYLLFLEALVFRIVLNLIGDNKVDGSGTNTLMINDKSDYENANRSNSINNNNQYHDKNGSNLSNDSNEILVHDKHTAPHNESNNALTKTKKCSYGMFRTGLGMWGMWQGNVPRMKRRVYQFDRLLKWTLPRLHAHFLEVEMAPEIIVAQWFGTLFAYSLSVSAVIEIWDYVFLSDDENENENENGNDSDTEIENNNNDKNDKNNENGINGNENRMNKNHKNLKNYQTNNNDNDYYRKYDSDYNKNHSSTDIGQKQYHENKYDNNGYYKTENNDTNRNNIRNGPKYRNSDKIGDGEEGNWSRVFRVSMSLLCDKESEILKMDLQEISGLLRNWKLSQNVKSIINNSILLSSSISCEVLLSLDQDFGLEIFLHTSSSLPTALPQTPISSSTILSRLIIGGDVIEEENVQTSWLSRYGKPKDAGLTVDNAGIKLKKIQIELASQLSQSEADKQIILIKIQKSCEALRLCQSTRDRTQQEHVRSLILNIYVFCCCAYILLIDILLAEVAR